jgi:hypothetical protein
MKKYNYLFLVSIIVFSFSCHCTKQNQSLFQPNFKNSVAQIVVYKTTKNYSTYVPVQLNNEGTKIISYPAPSDIFMNGKLALPTKLKNNYWLDNRGITMHTAFINYTYDEYSKLADAPSLDILFSKIIDKHPILEIYNCGAKTTLIDKMLIDALNDEIKNNGLKKCKCLTEK